MARQLQDIQVADKIGLHIGMRILQRIAHACLRSQVHYPRDCLPGEGFLECRHIAEVNWHESEGVVVGPSQLGNAILLELNRVIGIEVVYADDFLASRKQPCRDMKAYESGGPSHEDRHEN